MGGQRSAPPPSDVLPEGPLPLCLGSVQDGAAGAECGAGARLLPAAGPDRGTVLKLKFLFFLAGLSYTTWGRFATVYYNRRHMTATQIGLVEATMPLVVAVANPIWGGCADYFGSKKWVYLFTSVVGSGTLCLLAFDDIATTWHVIWGISLAMSVFSSSGVIDAYALEVCGDQGKKEYGRIRMWCAASWGLGAFIMGLISDRYGFNWNFILFASLALCNAVAVGTLIPARTQDELQRTAAQQKGETTHQLSVLLGVLTTPAVLVFLAEVFVAGACIGVVERLLFIYVENDLGGNTTLCGLIVLVTVIPELPIFHNAEAIMNRLGIQWCLALSYLSYAIRVAGYTFLHSDTRYYILLLELLHGSTFALMWVSAVERARLIALNHCPEWMAAIQAVTGATYYSLGVGSGALVGGVIFDHYGARWMYRGSASLMGALFLLRCCVAICLGSAAPPGPGASPARTPRTPGALAGGCHSSEAVSDMLHSAAASVASAPRPHGLPV
eukprot:TRINITY_DN43021_c0_g1_i1.p1 TRINITY_DN43021_c0_g1~~TRINITY_DN43021_c0_g1_i1.p1  ORF type:complete len:549 (+),score=175.27 TRINITY_DN43021_c0_g1_i1:152-1648(+)